VGLPNDEGYRPVLFEIDGFRREIYIEDKRSLSSKEKSTMLKADTNNAKEIGSNIPGTVLKVLVNEGESVVENQPLIIIEAMKMETEIVAHGSGKVKEIYVSQGQNVQSGELILTME
ncbi:MAG: biotin/lipoyl-containing protein, partial [Eubacterium sp.]